MSLWQIVLIHFITFIAIVFVLRKIMYSASFTEAKRLQQLNQENAKKAQELANRIEEAQKAYKEKIAQAEDEIRKLKLEAKEEAERLKEEAVNKAKEESERIVNQALNTREKLKEEIEAQMKGKVIDESLNLIQDVLSSKNQRLLHEVFIDEVMEEIERIEQGKFKTQAERGELITPYEIERGKREKIKAILSKKTGKKLSLEEKIDKGLIAGITIKLGSLIIDGSLAGKLREAAEALRR
jgi:ATP synthase F1 delta subunit